MQTDELQKGCKRSRYREKANEVALAKMHTKLLHRFATRLTYHHKSERMSDQSLQTGFKRVDSDILQTRLLRKVCKRKRIKWDAIENGALSQLCTLYTNTKHIKKMARVDLSTRSADSSDNKPRAVLGGCTLQAGEQRLLADGSIRREDPNRTIGHPARGHTLDAKKKRWQPQQRPSTCYTRGILMGGNFSNDRVLAIIYAVF